MSEARRPLARSAGLAAAAAAAAAAAFSIALLRPWWFASASFLALYVATPVGKEAWLLVAPARLGLPLALAAGLVLALNAAIAIAALVLLPSDRLVARLPRAGARLSAFAHRVQKSRIASRSLSGALALVVFLPIHSGGAALGCLAGRAMGLTRGRTFTAVMSAIAARTLLVTVGAYGIGLAGG